MIKKLWHDGNDRLLVSAFNGGMRVFDERQGRFSDLYMNHPASGQPLSVYDFAKEGDRGIWLTDPDAELMYKDASTGRVETVRLTDAQGNAVRIHIETLFHDERGNLWLVGHDGAYVVDPATRRILKRHYIAEAPYSVNNLCSYCVTSDSDIWFGTRGGGVNLLRRNGSYVNFRDRNGEGLEGKTVFGILEDTPSKDVWFSTNDGLYYYDHTDGVIRKSQIDIPNRCGAYLVYAALLSAVAYFIWRYFTNKKIFEQRLELERIKEQNMKQLTQARINFFTNISHDLKTPLTLVVDPLKQLKEHLPANAPGNAYVHLIEKNVGRIQRMISQLLQFREIESQKITLNRQPGDLIRFIDSIFSLFEFYANKKGIETGFNSQYESFYTKFDHDVIEKIFTNLFSNAIKYASENGYVGVRIYPARQDQRPESAPPAAGTEYIAFTVTNTGAEIPDDKKEAIFESFNHLSDRRPQFESSSGLGLAIVKELVGNLNGTITLRSGNSKVAFTVVLPFTLNAEKTDSAAESYEYTVSEIDNLLTESDVMAPNDRHDRKACNIVVIEDDPNLRSYLEQRLSKHYNVYTAANGSEGIAKAERICPQIVITDLMMPEADGFEVCRSLRSNIKTSHIPVIMLSALGKNTENKIKALECGANVFIDKPFDMDFLLKQVANLIRSQQELKERYSKKYIAEPSKITISSMDEELLKKAMNYIERNMDNSDYNVDSFVSDMSIGRTLLYQKINDITGMSIKEFIMDVRLKRSAQLLRESDLTISEISVLTGFANPKYFSICFKRHFELTPSEFKKKS